MVKNKTRQKPVNAWVSLCLVTKRLANWGELLSGRPPVRVWSGVPHARKASLRAYLFAQRACLHRRIPSVVDCLHKGQRFFGAWACCSHAAGSFASGSTEQFHVPTSDSVHASAGTQPSRRNQRQPKLTSKGRAALKFRCSSMGCSDLGDQLQARAMGSTAVSLQLLGCTGRGGAVRCRAALYSENNLPAF